MNFFSVQVLPGMSGIIFRVDRRVSDDGAGRVEHDKLVMLYLKH